MGVVDVLFAPEIVTGPHFLAQPEPCSKTNAQACLLSVLVQCGLSNSITRVAWLGRFCSENAMVNLILLVELFSILPLDSVCHPSSS